MHNPNIYSYWKNGEKLFTGSIEQIAEFMNTSKANVYYLKYHPKKDRFIKYEETLVPCYELFTPSGLSVFRGTAEQCADYLCISVRSVKGEAYLTKIGCMNGNNGALLVRKIGYIGGKTNGKS